MAITIDSIMKKILTICIGLLFIGNVTVMAQSMDHLSVD